MGICKLDQELMENPVTCVAVSAVGCILRAQCVGLVGIFVLSSWLKLKKKPPKSLNPNELPLDIPAVQLRLSLLTVLLNLSTVGQKEELCQLRAADVVHMSWSRNSSY